MSTPFSVTTLFTVETAAKIFSTGIEVAKALGVPVTSWRTGDPSRSLYKFTAQKLATLDGVSGRFIKAGFLSTAAGDWLTILAFEVYNVERGEATYADPTVTVKNTKGGFFEVAPGDLTFKNGITGKTYHNTSGGTLSAGATVTFDLVADEAGSDSSAGLNEIDELVTTLLGCVVQSSTVGLANDQESDEELKTRCRASLGALSPNGPADAYEYIALTPAITGNTSVNRARAFGSTNGTVTVIIASQSGAADAAAITAVQTAILRWSTPLTVLPTTVSADVAVIDRSITIVKDASLAVSSADLTASVLSAIDQLFRETKIGGRNGGVSESEMTSVIHALYPNQITSVTDCDAFTLGSTEVPTRGTWTVVIA